MTPPAHRERARGPAPGTILSPTCPRPQAPTPRPSRDGDTAPSGEAPGRRRARVPRPGALQRGAGSGSGSGRRRGPRGARTAAAPGGVRTAGPGGDRRGRGRGPAGLTAGAAAQSRAQQGAEAEGEGGAARQRPQARPYPETRQRRRDQPGALGPAAAARALPLPLDGLPLEGPPRARGGADAARERGTQARRPLPRKPRCATEVGMGGPGFPPVARASGRWVRSVEAASSGGGWGP